MLPIFMVPVSSTTKAMFSWPAPAMSGPPPLLFSDRAGPVPCCLMLTAPLVLELLLSKTAAVPLVELVLLTLNTVDSEETVSAGATMSVRPVIVPPAASNLPFSRSVIAVSAALKLSFSRLFNWAAERVSPSLKLKVVNDTATPQTPRATAPVMAIVRINLRGFMKSPLYGVLEG